MNTQRNFLLTLLLVSTVTFSGCGSSSEDPVVESTPTVVNTTVTTIATTADVNGTTIVILTSYDLMYATESDSTTMGLNDTKSMSFYVQNNSGEKISDSDMTSLSITLESEGLGYLRDIDSNIGTSLSFTTNNASVSLESNSLSGLMPIHVIATFLDSDGTPQTLDGVFGITILSGAPTHIDMEDFEVSYDSDRSRFVDKVVVLITDKYGNKVNTNPSIFPSMILGYALEVDGNQSTRIFYETGDAKAATMKPLTNVMSSSADFTNVDTYNEFILTYGNGYKNNVSGKWDISSISGNDITLVEDLNISSNVSSMAFAIGHGYRQEMCRDGRKGLAYIEVDDYRFNDNGQVEVSIYYDNYMVGKSIAFAIDTVGYTADGNTTSKFGHMIKHTFLSTGFKANTCYISAGASAQVCDIYIKMTDTNKYLRNAYFSGDPTSSGNKITYSINSGSSDDIYDCGINGFDGIAHRRYLVSNADVNESGTFTLDNILTGSEF